LDSPWKEALDRYFAPCLAFFFSEAHAEIDWGRGHEMLDKELQKIIPQAKHGRRIVDKLVKVWLKSGEERWLLIHIEVQARKEREFARRMYVYNYRIFDRYDREVISFAILADDDPTWRPSQYHYGRWGCRAGIAFPAPKLLDYATQVDVLEADPNPFAVVVLAHLKAMETQHAPAERHAWKIHLVRALYERGRSAEDVRQLFRFIDWIMALPEALDGLFWQEVEEYQEEKHMPFISTPERVGMKKGYLAGIELGLKLKFGADGLQLMPEIRELHEHELLADVLQAIETAASPDALRRIWTRKRRAKKDKPK
jgi:hypothetical protein